MVKVFFSVDVEIWLNGWNNLDEKFPESFRRYVYGPTPNGNYALPLTLDILNDHGLKGVFFVEPLFATRFGVEPLREIVQFIQEAGQEVQMHMHSEWVDEAKEPVLSNAREKRQYMRYFSLDEQKVLINRGLRLLTEAGASNVTAFRAGGFGMNLDTLKALAFNGIIFDSSYNHVLFGAESGIFSDGVLLQPTILEGVYEYPMSVYEDRPGHYRHLQLGACSFREMEQLLWHAYENDWDSVVILSHNFELLNQRKDAVDQIVLNRYRKLARFLERYSDCFQTTGFTNLKPQVTRNQPKVPSVTLDALLIRYAEQAWRKTYR